MGNNLSDNNGSCFENPEKKTKINKIGFEAEGKKYDFFTDADGNGELSNIQEFFGSENGMELLASLDLNGDGKITGDEMDAANLKMVITDENGFQQIIKASELFNEENEAIDLTSYKEINQDLNEDVSLIGNFNIILNDFGGDVIEGCNTSESFEFLYKNYKFTDYEIQVTEAEELVANAEELSNSCLTEEINFEEVQQKNENIDFDEQDVIKNIKKELFNVTILAEETVGNTEKPAVQSQSEP